jgi:hypothetical protein
VFGQIRLEWSDRGLGLRTSSRIPLGVYNSGPGATVFDYRPVR